MTPSETFLSKLSGVTKTGAGWAARCPAHDDRKASLSVNVSGDGTVLVKCHAGCTTAAVLAAVGLPLAALFHRTGDFISGKSKPKSKTYPTAKDAVVELERQHGPRTAWWVYHDAENNPAGVVVRWDRPGGGKDIRPVARHPDGWRVGAMSDPRPLYGLPELAPAGRVLVVEGEKAADAARALGFTTTTSAGGSQAAGKTDWRPLAGKEVWILPDNDAPGRKYADTVAGILAALTPAPVVRVVELPGLPEHGDMVDWINAHGDPDPDDLRRELEALADAVPPELAATDAGAFKPFPVDVLPEPVRGFVAVGAKSIGCDPSFLALPLLVALAAAVGTSRRLELKPGWSAPAILWGAVVGESGTAKTPAFVLVMRPVRERQRKAMERHAEAMKRYESALACWEKDMTTWKRSKNQCEEPPAKPDPPPCERFIVSDTTVEALAPLLLTNPRGVLLARDELSGWIGSFDRYAGKGKAGADSANWLSVFNAESIVVDRKTGIPRTVYVPQAAVCVCGGIQPGILRRALTDEHRESGLAARLLLTWPPRKAKRWTEAEIAPNAEAGLARLVDRLFELQPPVSEDGHARPALVRLTPDAKAVWIAYYNAHAVEQSDLTGDMAAAWAKLEEYAARLALVVHYIRRAAGGVADELRLDADSMTAGIALATWFKGEARRVYALLEETGDERDRRRLVEWIGCNGRQVTVRQVQQGCRWLKEPGVAEDALNGLVKCGLGNWQELPTTARGGRPSRTFTLSARPPDHTPTTEVEGTGFVDVDNSTAGSTAPNSGRLFPEERGLPD